MYKNQNNIDTCLKLALAFLLLICLFKMPYGFYQIMRFVSFIGFSYLAYRAYELKSDVDFIIYLAIAILIQPFLKIALGRLTWNVVDIVVAAFLFISILRKKLN